MKILALGVATLDIINTVESYPAEDDEVRALRQSIQRGGNASNTLVLLSAMGHQCSWAGVLADDPHASFIRNDLAGNAVMTDFAIVQQNSASPLSCITLSQVSGKRCIVHYRDLREFAFNDFMRIDVSAFDWIHFEGRNVEQTLLMLHHLRETGFQHNISIEIEKPREHIEQLFSLADILVFSKVYAEYRGFIDAAAFLQEQHAQYPGIEQYCAWGEGGAYAIDRHGSLHHAAAEQSIDVVDTLGAGDVFNAGVIDASIRGLHIQDGLQQACKLAGRKCGRYGFTGVVVKRS